MRAAGPLGAMALSRVARRALAGVGVLAALAGVALVVQAWAIASVLADIVAGAEAPIGGRLGVLAGAVLARALLGWATEVVAARAAAGAKAELRAVLLDRALAAGPEWIVHTGPAELTALATRGLDALDAYFTTYLPALVNAAVLPLGIGAVILFADWPSALVIAATLPLVPLFAILVGLRTRDRVAEAADATGRLSAHLLELARALPVLTAFRRAAGQADVVRRVSDAHRRATMGTLRVAFASALVLELIATLSVALVAVTIGLRLVSGDLALAVGLFVLILAPECYLPLRAAGAAHHASEDGQEAARRIADLPVPGGHRGTRPPVGDLVVRDLSVRRRDTNAPDGLSLAARPGEIVHLNQPSGSGKSTLFAVLLGFTAPTEGRVQVGGTDLADLDLAAWRRRIAWVPQHPKFTADTVVEELSSCFTESTGESAAVCGEVSVDVDRLPVARSAGTRRSAVGAAEPSTCGEVTVDIEAERLYPVAARPVERREVAATRSSCGEVALDVDLLDRQPAARSVGTRRVAVGTAMPSPGGDAAMDLEAEPLRARLVADVPIGERGDVAGRAACGEVVAGFASRSAGVADQAVGREVAVGVGVGGLPSRSCADVPVGECGGACGEGFADVAPRLAGVAERSACGEVSVGLGRLPGRPRADVPAGDSEGVAARWSCGEGALAAAPLPAGVAERVIREVATEVGIGHLLDRAITELSTGERQRVAVARALVRVRAGADLLLLDEPTAHLEPASAGRVMAAVERAAARGAAVVLAAHRTVESTSDATVAAEHETATTEVPATRPRLRTLLDRRLLTGAVLGAAALVAGVALTVTSAWLIAKASQQPPILTLSVAVVGVRAFGLARAVLRYVERLVTHDAAFRAAGDLRANLWRALVRRGPAHNRSDDLPRLIDDIDTVRDLTPRVLIPPLVAALVCVVAVLVQLAILPTAGVALAIAVAVAGLGAPAAALALDRHAGTALAAGRRRIAAGTLTLLDAAADLIAYGNDRRHRAAVAAADADVTRAAKREAFGAGAATLVITFATGAAALTGTALAAAAVANGTLHPLLAPVCALLPLALAEVLALVPPAAQHRDALRGALARVRWNEQAPSPGVTLDTSVEVHLDGVDVGWPGAEPVLRDVTLDIPRGTHVAVVGPSGSGKSTLLALLLRFLEPEAGTARIPRAVAWCPQEPHLVSTTVRENLRLGDPDATDTQLADALRRAGLPHWTNRLDTRLAGGAASTSGGEAQRLALARALLAAPKADLVLLDEPTAHLDIPTAQQVLREVATLPGTVVHVTHRAEEAEKADLIVEVAHGRVNSVRMDHSHPQGSPGVDVTGGDRQRSAAGGRVALA